MNSLAINNLRVSIGEQEIIRGLSLSVPRGEVHAIMGPNGSGKSTLAKVIAGHPDYKVTSGDVLMDGESILEWEPDVRARKGIFLAFQYPSEIPGVSIANFLRAAVQSRLPEGEELEATDYYAKLYQKMDMLEMDRAFTSRSVNEGFSGGEKKRNEILQLALLEPSYAVLDETDSGLDIDALKVVAKGVNALRGPNLGVLLITHYQRLLDSLLNISGESQSPRQHVLRNQLSKAWLIDGHHTRREAFNLFRVDIYAGDIDPKLSKACACYQTDVSGADYRDMH